VGVFALLKEPPIWIVQGVFQCVENSSFEEGGNPLSVFWESSHLIYGAQCLLFANKVIKACSSF
jgi:hypothetical protein